MVGIIVKLLSSCAVRDGFIQASGPPDPERPDSDYGKHCNESNLAMHEIMTLFTAEHQPLLNTRQGDVDLYGSVIEGKPLILYTI